MNPYWLDFQEGVKETIDALPSYLRQRIKRQIIALRTDPQPVGVKALRGELAGCYEISLRDWRIIFEPIRDEAAIIIHKVGKKHGPEFFADIQPRNRP